MSGAEPRASAARVLDAVLNRGRSLKTELARALPPLPDTRDRALVEAICFAALRQHARADAALAAWIPKPLGQRDGDLRALLHAGFAQLDPLGLAPHAALAATVDAARLIGRAHQARLVNALLRRAQREGLPAVAADAAWPAWLRDQVRGDWPADADAIFAASALPAPTWLRVNRQRGDRDTSLARLREAGIDAAAVDGMPDALRIEGSLPVAMLPGFAEGVLSVQDGAAQRVADVLAPAAGARVLDACVAPGGKSAQLMERDPGLRLVALDIDPARLGKVREGWARIGVGAGAELRAADACDTASWWDGTPFDAVLLDAPCSATGIVRRQPDVLLHRRPEDLASLIALQWRLLDACWKVLKPGGVLVYATCSILKDENERQVAAFLARTPDAHADPLDDRHGHAAGPGRQRLPGEQGMDGFFYARLTGAG
ncbi:MULTISPECIES: 16S rRNA (cytosine(967)-C(5))-methyltransferase RsmB [unclassified Luteimonas]|uniref:16S rRNA (cytosine(967)-C(5))-methyltransferase RsmB n=1 Tax=unclassified Luteimonas TaxID=2629088 RepID=UPI001601C665|nr:MULTISPECIES: 16S rRNA (cytosine(967)-C(5))-methyltransferase RsmB [unclassified Luteimonas]MBB1473484.1 16S rRNA (cytosine(967)-C(5))-methyltransferase RsmB [Luteimonas sp. MC1782]MBB6600346.1 16S rRNA (cytosine(967)-C(5))-methyltransferase RsmB [Luteimonas sp. MC1825]QOC88023.1 16S rRNA (cytosine(967)-C(5))-methyltransferase RsmB [Luteimonas sp. MC1825]